MIALSVALAYLGTLAFALFWARFDDRLKIAHEGIALERERLERQDIAGKNAARALELAEELMKRWQPAAEDMAQMRQTVNTLAVQAGLRIPKKQGHAES